MGSFSIMSRRDNRRVSRRLLLWIPLSAMFILAGRSTSESAAVKNGPVISVEPGQFAIADFDGDVHPDLATIQAGSSSPGTVNYWIQLQLSGLGQQSIQLLAPAGGLSMEARDVNGDHSIDLVLATAWFRQPVAILLNDGHGTFSRIQPTVFPEAFSNSNTNWVAPTNHAIGALGFPPRSQAHLYSKAEGSLRRRASVESILSTGVDSLVNPCLISHAGRAPPSEVSHS